MTSSITTFDNLATNAQSIDFNKEWANGTGYYDYAVSGEHAPVLPCGEVRTCVDLKNRRLVLIGTSKEEGVAENIIFFDRFSDRNGVIVNNWATVAERHMLKNYGVDLTSSVCDETLKKFCQLIVQK